MYNPYATSEMDGTPKEMYPVLAWRGILKLLAEAERAIAERRVEDRHRALMRAQNLVAILDNAVDMDHGGEAMQLVKASHHNILQLMVYANLSQDVGAVQKAREIAVLFEEMWSQAVTSRQQP